MCQQTLPAESTRAAGARRIALVAFLVGSLLSMTALASGPQPPQPKGAEPGDLPKFEEIEALVHKELAKQTSYKTGDLLSRGEISGQFRDFEKLGWKVSDRDSLEEKFLSDSDVVARELKAPNARSFMRHVSTIPNGFDRVDRLRRMPLGQQRLQELIRGPDGHLLIQYLATTPSGRRTGSSIAQGEDGQGFNRPTGRIYTEKQWIEELRVIHARDVAERLKTAPKSAATK